MLFTDVSFHDALILEVREHSLTQTIDFIVDFPVNWDENKFEKTILRFKDVIFYNIHEILFSGYPTILKIDYEPPDSNSFMRIKMETTAGDRVLEYKDAEFLHYT